MIRAKRVTNLRSARPVIPQYFPMIPTLFPRALPPHRRQPCEALPRRRGGDRRPARPDARARRARWRSSTSSSARASPGCGATSPSCFGTPPLLMAFDVLYRDGEDLTGRPLARARHVLEAVIAGSAAVLPTRRLAADGLEAWPKSSRVATKASSPRTDAEPVSRRRHAVAAQGQGPGLDRFGRPMEAPADGAVNCTRSSSPAFSHSSASTSSRCGPDILRAPFRLKRPTNRIWRQHWSSTTCEGLERTGAERRPWLGDPGCRRRPNVAARSAQRQRR